MSTTMAQMSTKSTLKKGDRVYINEKDMGRETLAVSSATAATVRREGTVTKVSRGAAHVKFDHKPTVTTVVPVDVVFEVTK